MVYIVIVYLIMIKTFFKEERTWRLEWLTVCEEPGKDPPDFEQPEILQTFLGTTPCHLVLRA